MGCILIAMPKAENANHLSELIKNLGMLEDIVLCNTAAEVLREANQRNFGVILSTKKIFEMSYVEMVEFIPSTFGMIVLTKDMGLETVSDKMVKLIMPIKPRELAETIRTMNSLLEHRIRKKKKIPVRRSAQEQKIIDDAKAVLIERNQMTEPEAFRYIQKCSMDTGRNMVESAQMILMLSDG